MIGSIFMIVYSINVSIWTYVIKLNDFGGAIFVHVFGSWFGLTTSFIYSNKRNAKNNPNMYGSYSTIVLWLISTLLLWIIFPIYNGLVGNGIGKYRQWALTNSIFTLWAWTVTSFAVSYGLDKGKLDSEHIVNSTIASGIMIAAVWNIINNPALAILIGMIAGGLSVWFYKYIGPLLAKWLLFDTWGIFHLHFAPGVVGGIISAIAWAWVTDANLYDTDIKNVLLNGRTAG